MTAEVTITRDRWGIGHAEAPDAISAFWAQGWMAAADRMWQMEWDRRRALGTWAAVAGPSALREDVFFRRLGLGPVAQQHWSDLSPSARSMTEAYTDGVNAWLDANGADLPADLAHHPLPPEPWEPWHCLVVYKVRHLFMGTLHRKLWRGAVAGLAGADVATAMTGNPNGETAIVPATVGPWAAEATPEPAITLMNGAAEEMAALVADLAVLAEGDDGSNNWALHGSRTASGLPLLAGDPHRGIEFPNVYHQCHLRCDRFDVIGLGFPGVPGFPHFGHNERVAWSITHGMADDTDVFINRGPLASVRAETIEVLEQPGVAGAPTDRPDDGPTWRSVEVVCAATDWGPVVLGDPDADGLSLSVEWTGMAGQDTTFDCLWPMLEVTSVDEAEEVAAGWVIPANNLLTADVAGDISFRLRGRLVERPAASRWTPVPAAPPHGWQQRQPISDDRLPRWRNPDRGYLVTANNRTAERGPYVSVDFANPARHDRIVELIEPLQSATVDDMVAIHTDTRSLVAPEVIELMATAEPDTDGGRRALAMLTDWDHDLTVDSSAATVYTAAMRRWCEEVAARLGLDGAHLAEPGWPAPVYASRFVASGARTLLLDSRWTLVPGLDHQADLDALLGRVLDEVAADLTERLGPDGASWTWGRVHTMVSPHPLASARPELAELHPPVDACPGDGDTVRAAAAIPHTGERIASSSVARYVFDLADWDGSGWVVPHGVSGVRGSGHDLDQRPHWLAGELVPMAYTEAAVAAVAASVEVISTARREP